MLILAGEVIGFTIHPSLVASGIERTISVVEEGHINKNESKFAALQYSFFTAAMCGSRFFVAIKCAFLL